MPSKAPEKKKTKLTEQEKLAKRLENERKLLRDHMDRELKFTEISQQRIGRTHFDLAEKFKAQENVTDLTAKVQFTSHLMDKSQHAVETLRIHREHAQEQHLRIQVNQTELIDHLKDLFNLYQNSMTEMFEINRKSLVNDFLSEKLERDRIFYGQKYYYENFAHASVSLLKSRLAKRKEDFIDSKVVLDSIATINKENLYEKKLAFESKICEKIEAIFKSFSQQWPKHRLDEYYAAFAEDGKIIRITEAVLLKIVAAENEASHLKKLLKEASSENELKVTRLKFEYRSMLELLNSKKSKMDDGHKHDFEKLKIITQSAKKASSHLKDNLKLLHRISSKWKECKKLERAQDVCKFENEVEEQQECLVDLSRKLTLDLLSIDAADKNAGNKSTTCHHEKKLKCINMSNESILSFLNAPKKFSLPLTPTKSSEESVLLKVINNKEYKTVCSSDNQSPMDLSGIYKENEACKRFPSKSSLSIFEFNDSILHEFQSKLANVDADVEILKKVKKELTIDNMNLKNLLTKMKHQAEVDENLKILKLYTFKSVGKISQFAHQMPQINAEIIARKCREYHLKYDH